MGPPKREPQILGNSQIISPAFFKPCSLGLQASNPGCFRNQRPFWWSFCKGILFWNIQAAAANLEAAKSRACAAANTQYPLALIPNACVAMMLNRGNLTVQILPSLETLPRLTSFFLKGKDTNGLGTKAFDGCVGYSSYSLQTNSVLGFRPWAFCKKRMTLFPDLYPETSVV